MQYYDLPEGSIPSSLANQRQVTVFEACSKQTCVNMGNDEDSYKCCFQEQPEPGFAIVQVALIR